MIIDMISLDSLQTVVEGLEISKGRFTYRVFQRRLERSER